MESDLCGNNLAIFAQQLEEKSFFETYKEAKSVDYWLDRARGGECEGWTGTEHQPEQVIWPGSTLQ